MSAAVLSAADPFFCVVLRDAARWAVEAEWPDGSIELVEIFNDYLDALNWLTNKAAAWIEQRMPAMPEAVGDSCTTASAQVRHPAAS